MKKHQRRVAAPSRNLLSLAVASCFVAELALANPTGPTVASGSAGFSTVGSTLTVTNSPNAIINWRGFSIGAGETTRFQQQNAASAVLNRIVGQDPSAILGTLSSNGRVFLINPNGILFGQGSRVDVAGLVASTLNITDGDFLGGRLNFQAGAVAKSIVNEGELISATSGHIYLVAPDVTNNGLITSPKGEVVLAAGKSVSLVDVNTPNLKVEITAPEGAARNLGQIVAESGRIGVYAGLIDQQGIVRADSATRDAATGQIVLRATDSATLGTGSVISASGANGGKIDIVARKSLNVAGRLDASAPNGGDGGFIETSAAHVHVDPATVVTTAAPYGKTGTWLIDPNDYTIAAISGDITGATLSSNLGTTSVVITSDQGATSGTGAVNVNDTVSWASANSLTLIARGNVNVQSPVTNSGTGSILFYAGWDGASTVSPAVTPGTGIIGINRNVQTGGNISLTAGNDIFINASSGDLTVSATGNISISGHSLAIRGGGNEKAIVSAGILFDAQLTGDFSLTGGSNDGVTVFSGTADRSASLQANAVNINAIGNITVAGGEAITRTTLGATASANADASINATTSITMAGADVSIRAGDNTAAMAAQVAGGNTGINDATSSASATLTAGTNISISGTNITVRGGDQARAEANKNGFGVAIGTNTGNATTNANATLTAGGNISLTGTASVVIRGGDNGLAQAHSNGETIASNAGAGTGTSLTNANASLSAANISLNAPSVTVRGGDITSFAGIPGANFNGAGFFPGGNGTGSATLNTDASLTATNDISITAGSLTIRGGNGIGASATFNGGSNAANVGHGTSIANGRALLSATRDVIVVATGAVSIGGGASGSADACCNALGGGQGTGNATVNANADITAGRDISITGASLTVAGGDTPGAFAGSNGLSAAAAANGQATANVRSKLLATRDLTLNISGPILIRGGNNANGSAGRNGSDGLVSASGTAAVEAGAQVAATGNVTVLNATSLTVSGGDSAVGTACCNGQSLSTPQGHGVGTATTNTNAVLSAGQNMTIIVTAGAGTVNIRGGNNASASACCDARHSGAVAGSGTATVNAEGNVSAGGTLTLTANALTVRGGNGGSGNADLNGANGGANGVGVATINANAALMGQGMTLNVAAGPILIRGGDDMIAGASNNGPFLGGSGNGTATVNANATASAGTGALTITAGSLTVQGGVQGASFLANVVGSAPISNAATTNANASLLGAGLAYTGGPVVVQGGTARSQGAIGGTAQASANALVAGGAATYNVTGNFDVVGGSALDAGVSGASASATASIVGSTSVTSSGTISVGAVTGVVSGNASVTPSINAAPSGAITLIADDINLGPNTINTGIGTATLGTFSTTRDLVFEPGPSATPGVLSITSTELSGITAGSIVLRAGHDLLLNAGLGSSGTPLDRNVELRAGNNAQMTSNSIFLADNRSLTVVADNDLSGAGNVNIGGVTVKVGSTGGNTGSMTLQGQDINAVVSGGGTGLVYVTGSGNQTITAAGDAVFQNNNPSSGALTVQADGGSQSITGTGIQVIGGSGTNTSAEIRAGGTQNVAVGANSLVIIGGSGTATNSFAQILKVNASGTQTIAVGNGGNVILSGGSGSGTNNFAGIGASGTAQTLNFSSGGDLILIGGTNGTLNTAVITAANPTVGAQTQAISGADGISLIGGASGGGVDPSTNNVLGNFARINNQNGSQAISVGSAGITLTGGGGSQTANFALIIQGSPTGSAAGTTQSITVGNGGGVTLQGGSSAQTNVINNSNNFFRGSYAMIEANGDSQTINFTGGGGLFLTGGSVGSNNPAQIFSRNGLQTISGNPAITLQGGTGGYVDIALNKNEGNFAHINANTGGQTIDASSITLTGGGSGVGNHAQIFSASTTAAQSITAGNISLTGGAGGGINSGSTGNAMGNFALIQSNGPQTIDAVDVTLHGGAGGTENFAAIIAPTQVISVLGDLMLVGGASAAGSVRGGGSRIGGQGGSAPGPTSLTLDVEGDVTMTGGSAANSGTSIGSGIVGGQTTTVTMNVLGNVTLNPGIVANAGSFIGSPASNIAGGNISITAGGAIALNSTGPGLGTAIRTLGNVTLQAASITQGADSVIIAGNLTETTSGAITQTGAITAGNATFIAGSNPITLTNASNDFAGVVALTGSNVSVNDANALTFGPVNATNLTTTAGTIGQNSSGVTVGGTTTLSANSISLTTPSNDFGTVSVSSPGNVAITDANAISIGTSTVGGTFDIIAASTSFLNGFSANNYTFSGGSYSLAAGTYNLGGTTNVTSTATVTTSSGATLNAPGTMNVSGTFNALGGTLNIGTLNLLSGGTLSGAGTIVGNVNNSAGTVSPGASPGILTITGNYVQGPSGTLAMDIGGLTPGAQYDQLVVGGSTSLAGTLTTQLINGFVPVAGNSFTLIQGTGPLTGTFATINQPAGVPFNAFYGPTTFEFITSGIAAGGGSGSVPAPIEPTFNYAVTTIGQLSQPFVEVIDLIVVTYVAPDVTVTAEGKIVPKPPACN